MPQHVHANAFNVLGSDVAAAPEKGIGFGGQGERNGRSRRSAKLDEALELDLVFARVSRGTDQIDNVILNLVVDIDVIDELTDLQNLLCIDHRSGGWNVAGPRHQVENGPFLLA